MKIFGYNILTDKQIEYIKQDHWEDFKKYLKIKELWYIRHEYTQRPKCDKCNDKRLITVTLPDGSTTLVSCSCNRSDCTKVVDKLMNEPYIIAIKGENVYVARRFDEYSDITYRVITKESELKKFELKELNGCYFASERIAKKALKMIEEEDHD